MNRFQKVNFYILKILLYFRCFLHTFLDFPNGKRVNTFYKREFIKIRFVTINFITNFSLFYKSNSKK